jgi:hypothetical protein
VGLLRGDEMVADYLARLGKAAADLPAPDRTWLVESARRRIRERAGGPGTRDEALVEDVLRELGEPESVVAAAGGGEPDRAEVAEVVVQAGQAPADAASPPPPVPVDEPSFGRGDEDAPAPSDPDDDADRTAPFPPLFAQTDPQLVLPADLGSVRPAPAHVDAGPDLLTSFTGVKLEIAALAALAVAPSVLGLVGFAIAVVLVALSRFWPVREKVAVTLGFTLAGVLLSVLAAWLSATRLQESGDPGTRLATAGHSLAHSLHALPAAVGWIAALYLGYVLVRDLNEHGRG